jgi:hypothetical protein
MSEKNTHQLIVNLEGLKLSEDHLQRINQSIQKAVMTELASIDLNGTQGGLLSGFDPRTRGIWYVKDLNKILQ